ncbi:FAD-binding oxidoreductase [Leifsonia sp. 2MCAF36]|uniref:FAD-binding oxidoreductase n=1 Tax=Leifsonia sp. 2MCAF36 TaxID=3232988 RepID=UPI003F9452B2
MSSIEQAEHRPMVSDVIHPSDPRYAQARRTRLISGSPSLVIVPNDIREVSAAVRFAGENQLEIAVRGGGHSFAGFSTTDSGIVVDLARLTDVTVLDEERHIVRIGGGATWGHVADVLSPRGLAISSGDTRSVGVGGLTLSGGLGWKVRRYGLALDSLRAIEIVVADGTILRASASENRDLFWAIRGGGGNFGIVTAFDFIAHPSTDVFFGKLTFPPAEAASVLEGWAHHLSAAPEQLTSIANLANPVTGGPVAPVEVYVCWDGDDLEEANRALAPLRQLGTVLSDDVGRCTYASILDEGGTVPEQFRIATRSGFVDGPSVVSALRKLVEVAQSEGTPFISIRALGGALSRVPADGTAYAHRSAALMVATISGGLATDIEAGQPDRERMWEELRPHLSGAYANFLDSATPDDVNRVYPSATYRRLASVKRRYDPANLFRLNHNVIPADECIEHTSS